MDHPSPPPPAPLLEGSCLAFIPAPRQRRRADGWTPETPACFIRALEPMGSVGPAAQEVGLGRASDYLLRARPAAESACKGGVRGAGVSFSVCMVGRDIQISQ